MKKVWTAILGAALLLASSLAFAADSFDLATGRVTIGSLVIGTTEYRNIVLIPGQVVSFSNAPATSTDDVFDFATGHLTIRSLAVNGVAYSNVVITVASLISVGSSVPVGTVPTSADRPLGTYAGAPRSTIFSHPQLRGVLLRAAWSSLEPAPGQFDFTALDSQLKSVRAAGKPWSLAVGAGGPGSPAWLMDQLGVPFVDYRFRGTTPYRLPLAWNDVVQQRLTLLAERLAQQYGGDATLKLIYVPQMTANGIEGHLNGVDMTAMVSAGYTDDRWVTASTQTATAFARAFASKALAFEVHDINGGATVPSRILQALQDDAGLGGRVGAAIWWLSGRTDYQGALLQVLADFPGDKYGQVIARSDESSKFADGDYRRVFSQAQQLGLRYLEPWEYDFGTGANTANGAWDGELAAFNQWADARFLPQR